MIMYPYPLIPPIYMYVPTNTCTLYPPIILYPLIHVQCTLYPPIYVPTNTCTVVVIHAYNYTHTPVLPHQLVTRGNDRSIENHPHYRATKGSEQITYSHNHQHMHAHIHVITHVERHY